jgi:hypothetical protein
MYFCIMKNPPSLLTMLKSAGRFFIYILSRMKKTFHKKFLSVTEQLNLLKKFTY